MKNLLLLIAFLITIPAHATCSIEEGGSCKVAEVLRQPMQNTYQVSKPLVKEFGGTGKQLQPAKNDAPAKQLRNFGPKQTDYSYSTSCQFGICNPGGTKLFPNR